MFYLIHKITGELKAEDSVKGRLRRLQKLLTDRTEYKVSRYSTLAQSNVQSSGSSSRKKHYHSRLPQRFYAK